MVCPVCGGKATGKVGIEQFYCWDCCVEFRKTPEQVQVYDVAEDGSLVAWDDDLDAPYM
ncbi:MAG: hypothetical protein M0Z31_15580 [Clostridia bacterium]|nr:hypothetical protein [Clostridia bacterium]